jgi:hypothetical protein
MGVTGSLALIVSAPLFAMRTYGDISKHATIQHHIQLDRAMALTTKEIESLRAALHRKEEDRQSMARSSHVRWNVPEALNLISVAVPSDLSLQEAWIKNDSVRMRGIAAHGGAIRTFLEALGCDQPNRECAIESVQRIEDRGVTHDEFFIHIESGLSTRARVVAHSEQNSAVQTGRGSE